MYITKITCFHWYWN